MGRTGPKPPTLDPIALPSRTTYADGVVRAIRDAVLDGRLAPGQRLTEPGLATQLRVSRTPIREAFRALEHEGLLQRVPGRGIVVAEVSGRDVEEIYAVKSALESVAVREACRTLTEAELDALHGLFKKMEVLSREPDLRHYTQVSREFHAQIIRSAGNRWLWEVYRTVDGPIQRLRAYALATPGRPKSSVAEHAAILDALARRDPGEAERLIRAHVERAGAILAAALSKRRQPAAAPPRAPKGRGQGVRPDQGDRTRTRSHGHSPSAKGQRRVGGGRGSLLRAK